MVKSRKVSKRHRRRRHAGSRNTIEFPPELASMTKKQAEEAGRKRAEPMKGIAYSDFEDRPTFERQPFTTNEIAYKYAFLDAGGTGMMMADYSPSPSGYPSYAYDASPSRSAAPTRSASPPRFAYDATPSRSESPLRFAYDPDEEPPTPAAAAPSVGSTSSPAAPLKSPGAQSKPTRKAPPAAGSKKRKTTRRVKKLRGKK
jgi:hypothetical protein